jgi:hypothetical protein
MKDCTNCQICSTYLHKGNVSKAHAGLCKDCYAAVTRYKRYLKVVDKTEEQIHFIREMNKVFVINEIDGKYVPKAYYTEGRRV